MRALDLMGDLGDTVYTKDVFEQATAADLPVEVRVEALRTVGRLGGSDISRRLEKFLQTSTGTIRLAAIQALGASNDAGARVALEALIRSDESNEIRSEAVRALGGSATGIHLLLDLAEAGQLPKELQGSAVIAVNRSRNQEIQKRVEKSSSHVHYTDSRPHPNVRVPSSIGFKEGRTLDVRSTQGKVSVLPATM